MREIKVKVYKFAELSEEAKDYVRSWFREEDCLELSCEVDSLKAIGDIIGKARYEVDAWNHVYVHFTPDVEEVMDMVGTRLLKWIWNNWIEPYMKGRYISTHGKFVDGKLHYASTHSKVTKVWDCPLTGTYMDMILYEAYKVMQEATKNGERWSMEDFIWTLERKFEEDWNKEIEGRMSDEYIDEFVIDPDAEFYADGTSYRF